MCMRVRSVTLRVKVIKIFLGEIPTSSLCRCDPRVAMSCIEVATALLHDARHGSDAAARGN